MIERILGTDIPRAPCPRHCRLMAALMFGNNPIEKADLGGDGQTLLVQEVFPTIQGEGPHAGRRATFIRLWGCHLKCWFCDTDFTSNKQEMTVSCLLDKCIQANNELVVLTGGEPMRQNLVPLLTALLAKFSVQIETAGNFWLPTSTPIIDECLEDGSLTIVVSPKGPAVQPMIRHYAYWKYVVSADPSIGVDPEDGLPICNYQERNGPQRPLARGFIPGRIFVQPMDEYDDAKNKANAAHAAALVQRYGYRLSLQQHKIVGVP